MQIMQALKKDYRFDLRFQAEKPVIFCERCGIKLEPQGYCNQGWPVQQYLLCSECEKVEMEEFQKQRLMEDRKNRRPIVRDVAKRAGVPCEKVNKVRFDDIKNIVIDQNEKIRTIGFKHLFELFLKYKSCLIVGESGAGKSHLATMMFLMSILEFASDIEEHFKWTSLIDVFNEANENQFEEKNIIYRIVNKKVLCFTFGEFVTEFQGGDSRKSRLEKILFSIIDKRLELTKNNSLYTIWMTTYNEDQLQDIGWPFYRRLLEMSFQIDMGKNKQYSEKMFQERPKVKIN